MSGTEQRQGKGTCSTVQLLISHMNDPPYTLVTCTRFTSRQPLYNRQSDPPPMCLFSVVRINFLQMMSRLLSAQHMPHMVCASDGFFLNLGWVLLKLAAPFTKAGGPVFRFPSIDPLYCVAAAREQRDNSLLNFTSETRMAPADSGQ